MFTCSNLEFLSKRRKTLILKVRLDLKKLQDFGKDFSWIKPKTCPSCHGTRLWGHGFVLRYFHNYCSGLWLKRYRCPDCGAVHTLRPEEYSPGFQYPWKEIQSSLEQKLQGSIFRLDLSRQCQQYWMKAYRFQQKRISNRQQLTTPPMSQKQVTFRLHYYEKPYTAEAPYLLFAVTTRPLRI